MAEQNQRNRGIDSVLQFVYKYPHTIRTYDGITLGEHLTCSVKSNICEHIVFIMQIDKK